MAPSSSVYYGRLYVVCCAQMGARRLRRLSPDVVAIAGATNILVAFSVVLTCCGGYSADPNKGSFPPSCSYFCCAQPNLLLFSLFSRPHSSTPLPPHSSYLLIPPTSFLPPLSCFYLDLLVLVFILVRVTVDLLACAMNLLMFFTEVDLYDLCLLIFIVILVCFFSSPDAFSIEAALSFFLSRSL
jgi:hypothetical protein